MANGYLETDKSIKPKDMRVGDLIVGHHEDDPAKTPPQILRDMGPIVSFRGPWPVTRIVAKPTEDHAAGVYYEDQHYGERRYVEYDARSRLWIIIRDRPGVPRFIEEFPSRCAKCKGKIYVGLNDVVHERGGSFSCPT